MVYLHSRDSLENSSASRPINNISMTCTVTLYKAASPFINKISDMGEKKSKKIALSLDSKFHRLSRQNSRESHLQLDSRDLREVQIASKQGLYKPFYPYLREP